MTIHAQLPSSSPVTGSPDPDQATHGMNASEPFVVDAFRLLDHRTRERLIPRTGAAAGRYLAVERDGENWLIALTRPITHIGRGLITDVRLEDPHVSRRHAILALRGDGARVLDDRSSNGTFVNGRRITVAYLSDGDVLRFGRAVLRYVEVARPRKPEPLRRIPPRRLNHWSEPAGTAA
jgi:hypothetical protein